MFLPQNEHMRFNFKLTSPFSYVSIACKSTAYVFLELSHSRLKTWYFKKNYAIEWEFTKLPTQILNIFLTLGIKILEL
jgi:hypothetical protein